MNDRIRNLPIKVRWGGWETDTFRLQNDGWQLSAHQDVYQRELQLALYHPELEVRGLSALINNYEHRALLDGNMHREIPFALHFQAFSKVFHVQGFNTPQTLAFNPIDARPMYEAQAQLHDLDDFAHFAKLDVPQNEIYLKEANLSQILAMAEQRQEPEQERIRAELLQQRQLQSMRDSKIRSGKLHTELRLVA